MTRRDPAPGRGTTRQPSIGSWGWLRLPDGRTLTGFAHEYRRHGTTTLFAALEVASGQVQTGHYRPRRRREFLDFIADCRDAIA